MDSPPKELVDAGMPVILGILISVARLLHEKQKNILTWLSGLFLGALTGYLTHVYLLGFSNLTEGEKAVIIALAGLLSHDVLKGLLAIGKTFREQPLTVIQFFRTGKWQETTQKSTETTTQNQNKSGEGHKETKPEN